MKRVILLILIINGSELFAQEDEIHVEVPGSPAFTILDFEPTSILRPSSVAELKTSVFNSFDENGGFAPNIGLEFSPYWLKSRDSLTMKEYENPNFTQTIRQTFQISAAVVEDTAADMRKMGLGVRFQLASGNVTDKYKSAYKKLSDQLKLETLYIGSTRGQILAGNITNISELKAHISQQMLNSGEDKLKISNLMKVLDYQWAKHNESGGSLLEFQDYLMNSGSIVSNDVAKTYLDANKERVGFLMEVGLAAGFNDLSGNSEENSLDQIGLWLNASHKYESGGQFIGSVKFIHTNRDSAASNIDVGLSYVRQLSDIALSIEAVSRWYRLEYSATSLEGNEITAVDRDFTYRIAANATYNLSNKFNINISLGRGFADRSFEASGFFSILGVNYNLFSKTTKLKPS
ncbi:MAG: hypothetical protein RIC80_04895 [Cyclobacteriaceae bacterium]